MPTEAAEPIPAPARSLLDKDVVRGVAHALWSLDAGGLSAEERKADWGEKRLDYVQRSRKLVRLLESKSIHLSPPASA